MILFTSLLLNGILLTQFSAYFGVLLEVQFKNARLEPGIINSGN